MMYFIREGGRDGRYGGGEVEKSLLRFRIWKCVCVFACVAALVLCVGQRCLVWTMGFGRRGGCSLVTQHLLCGTLLMSGHLCRHHHGAAPAAEQEPEDVSQENLSTLLVKVL